MLIITPDGLLTRLIQTDTWTLAFWRGLLSGVGMLCILLVLYRGQIWHKFRDLGWLGLLLAVMFGVSSTAFIYAFTHTTVANTLVIVNTSPVFAALMTWLFLKEAVPLRTWIVIVVVIGGVCVIAWADWGDGGSLLGNMAALWVAVSMAASFSIARYMKDKSVVPAVAIGGFVTAVVTLPFAQPLTVPSSSWGFLLILGLFVLPVSFALMYIGPRYVPAPEVSLMMLLEALLGPLWVWLVIGENPGRYTIIGGIIILGALAANSAIPILFTKSDPSLKVAQS